MARKNWQKSAPAQREEPAELKASQSDRDVASTGRHDHRCDHEGDRMAAAFGPRILCRRGKQEAEAKFQLGED
jgi:hypothetical protein